MHLILSISVSSGQRMDNNIEVDELKPLVNMTKQRVTTRPKSRLPQSKFSEPQKLDEISQEHLDVNFFFDEVTHVDSNKPRGTLSSLVDRTVKCLS